MSADTLTTIIVAILILFAIAPYTVIWYDYRLLMRYRRRMKEFLESDITAVAHEEYLEMLQHYAVLEFLYTKTRWTFFIDPRKLPQKHEAMKTLLQHARHYNSRANDISYQEKTIRDDLKDILYNYSTN